MTRKTLAGLLAGVAAVLVAAPAHAAGPKGDDYWLAPGSTITIVDDEYGTDEIQKFDLSNAYLGRLNGDSGGWFKVSRCAGGEVRVEITAQIWRKNADTSLVIYYASLYEGATCGTTDLDGGSNTWGWSNTDWEQFLRVDNDNEGGDYAHAKLKIKKTNAY